jgi:EAL domain-containing protein (putative c-di-GMP-specific phosphodiesterase class I)
MSVVVEGVETHQQLTALLLESSITEVQGFLFSRAVDDGEIRKRLFSEEEYLALTNVA